MVTQQPTSHLISGRFWRWRQQRQDTKNEENNAESLTSAAAELTLSTGRARPSWNLAWGSGQNFGCLAQPAWGQGPRHLTWSDPWSTWPCPSHHVTHQWSWCGSQPPLHLTNPTQRWSRTQEWVYQVRPSFLSLLLFLTEIAVILFSARPSVAKVQFRTDAENLNWLNWTDQFSSVLVQFGTLVVSSVLSS